MSEGVLADCLGRIRRAFPCLAFEVAELIDTGQDHAVVVLDGCWLFRFPRTHEYAGTFPLELSLLAALPSGLPFAVPDYRFVAPDVSFGGYRLIEGRPLDPRAFRRMDRGAQEALVAVLARFLATLHSLPPDVMRGPDGALRVHDGWARDHADRYFTRYRPFLSARLDPSLVASLDRLHEAYPHLAWERSAVVHNDLHGAHILMAPGRDNVAGLIDFGDAAFGDPAYDFTWFHALGAWAPAFALDAYGRTIDRDALLRRSAASFARYATRRLVQTLRGREAYDAEVLVEQLRRVAATS